MAAQLTKRDLKPRTEEYWAKKPGDDSFIEELLGQEFQHDESQRDAATGWSPERRG